MQPRPIAETDKGPSLRWCIDPPEPPSLSIGRLRVGCRPPANRSGAAASNVHAEPSCAPPCRRDRVALRLRGLEAGAAAGDDGGEMARRPRLFRARTAE